MSSKVAIYNQALLLIGAEPIVNFSAEPGATVEEMVGATMYEPIKSQLLRSYPWRCATKTARLARLADAPVDPNWNIAFAWPNDAIRILSVMPADSRSYAETAWEVEGQTVLTIEDNMVAKYIYDIPEPQLDAHVEMALVAQLAMDTAYAFTAAQGRESALAQMYANKLSEARTTDRQESSHKKFRTDTLTAVRY